MSTSRSVAAGLAWISPWLIGFALFTAYPVGMSIYYSFTDYDMLEPPAFVGTENYRQLWEDELFWRALRNTAVYAAFSVPLGTVVSLAVAILLHQNAPGARLARAIVFLPTLAPLVAAALGWMWLLNGEFGLVNGALAALGFRHPPDWLGDARTALPAFVVMSAWLVGGAVVIYLAALRDVPAALYEAAELDGVGAAGRLWHVTLPMISPVILFNTIIAVIGSLQVFVLPFVMTRGGPNYATYFYTQHVYANAFVYQRMGYACALAWVQFVLILLLSAGVLVAARRGVYYRAA